MDILIKSYNRPYLLHFTLKSIYKNICGDFNITIVDDGTPEIYLKKLNDEFPSVRIIKTIYHNEKSTIIENYERIRTDGNCIKLPHADWNKVINTFTFDYFLILEDDQFVVKKIDLNNIQKIIYNYNLQFLQFNVLNKKSFIFPIKEKLSDIYIYDSKSFIKKIKKFNFLFQPSNFYRPIIKILKKLKFKYFKLNFNKDIVDLYNIYIISGVIYKLKYWNICVGSARDELNENHQLLCAAKYNIKNKGELNFGITKEPHIKTTFSNTSLGNNRGANFDTTLFNILINKLWYKNDLNYFDETDYKLNVNNIISYLKNENNRNCNYDEWLKYTQLFENCYKDQGYHL